MNEKDAKFTVPVQAVIEELGAALGHCADVTTSLEDSIADWVASAPTQLDMPTGEIQRLDYLRQSQADLSNALARLAENQNLKGIEIDAHALLQAVKLGEIRDRVLKAGAPFAKRKIDRMPQSQPVSDVLLFGDDG